MGRALLRAHFGALVGAEPYGEELPAKRAKQADEPQPTQHLPVPPLDGNLFEFEYVQPGPIYFAMHDKDDAIDHAHAYTHSVHDAYSRWALETSEELCVAKVMQPVRVLHLKEWNGMASSKWLNEMLQPSHGKAEITHKTLLAARAALVSDIEAIEHNAGKVRYVRSTDADLSWTQTALSRKNLLRVQSQMYFYDVIQTLKKILSHPPGALKADVDMNKVLPALAKLYGCDGWVASRAEHNPSLFDGVERETGWLPATNDGVHVVQCIFDLGNKDAQSAFRRHFRGVDACIARAARHNEAWKIDNWKNDSSFIMCYENPDVKRITPAERAGMKRLIHLAYSIVLFGTAKDVFRLLYTNDSLFFEYFLEHLNESDVRLQYSARVIDAFVQMHNRNVEIITAHRKTHPNNPPQQCVVELSDEVDRLLRLVKKEVDTLPELEFMPFRAPKSNLKNETGVCAANATAQCYAAVLHHHMMKIPYNEKVKFKNEMSKTRYGRFLLSMLGWWHPRKFDTHASWQCTEGKNDKGRVPNIYFYFPVEHVLPLKKLLSMDYLMKTRAIDTHKKRLHDAKMETTTSHTTHLGFVFESDSVGSYRLLMEEMYSTKRWKSLPDYFGVINSLDEKVTVSTTSKKQTTKSQNFLYQIPLFTVSLPRCPPYMTFFHSGDATHRAKETPTHFFMYNRGKQVRYNFLCGLVTKDKALEKKVIGMAHSTAICRYMDSYYELDDGMVQEVYAMHDLTGEIPPPPEIQEPIEDSYEDQKMNLEATQKRMSGTWSYKTYYFGVLIYAKDETGSDNGRLGPSVV